MGACCLVVCMACGGPITLHHSSQHFINCGWFLRASSRAGSYPYFLLFNSHLSGWLRQNHRAPPFLFEQVFLLLPFVCPYAKWGTIESKWVIISSLFFFFLFFSFSFFNNQSVNLTIEEGSIKPTTINIM